MHLLQLGAHRGVEHFVADDTRTPPISDGSTVDRGVQLAAESLFQRGDQRRSAARRRVGNALTIMRVGGAFLCVLQHVELRGDFRQQRQAAVFDQHAR